MISVENQILNEKKIRQIVKRFAFEIYENFYEEKEIIFVGVQKNGYELALLIKDAMDEIGGACAVKMMSLQIEKDQPLASEIQLSEDPAILEGRSVILVDDVLNSGRTMAHCLTKLLQANVRKLETVVLVARNYKRFPILATYRGYKLSTTIDEHVEVIFEKDKFGVYLY